MRIRSSYVWAIVIGVVIIGWLVSGQLGGAETDGAKGPKAAAEAEEGLVTVRARRVTGTERTAELTLRGRTEAVRKVEVRAETQGRIVALPFERGAAVKEGDTLCEIDVDAREASLKEAEALMEQRRLEYEAALQLTEKGVRSEVQKAASKSAFEQARANLERARIELDNTRMKAPFDGIFDDRRVEIGTLVRMGDVCGLVLDMNPFLVVGMVSEREIADVAQGAPARITLVTGEEATGQVRFVARQADPATRTFRIEIEVPGVTGVRDGVTADLHVPKANVIAHHISPAILSLDDNGVLGVRIIDDESRVAFVPVKIVDRDGDGVWVAGLPQVALVITVGQDYVVAGQKIKYELERDGAGA